jgi:hypothetical protein
MRRNLEKIARGRGRAGRTRKQRGRAAETLLSVPELLRAFARISRVVRTVSRDRENWIKSENVD